MGITQYLAMTEQELSAGPPPSCLAYLGCRFSESGLGGLPQSLPPGALLILDDRAPLENLPIPEIGEALGNVLARFSCRGLLLDFQRPGILSQKELAAILSRDLPCPVAAPPEYAPEGCPVFLPPVPVDCTVENHLAPWQGREIWLDLAADAEQICLTPQGASITPAEPPQAESFFTDPRLHCRYRIETQDQTARFTLWRTKAEISVLQQEAQTLGVHRFIGLYQELGKADRYSPIFHQFR